MVPAPVAADARAPVGRVASGDSLEERGRTERRRVGPGAAAAAAAPLVDGRGREGLRIARARFSKRGRGSFETRRRLGERVERLCVAHF